MDNENLVKTYQANPSEDILQELLDKNNRLIWKVIKDYGNKNNDQEDSFQDAVEGFINAIESFKFDKNTKFSTWAYQQIRNYIQNNDIHYDRRERQIYRYLNQNPDKTHEEIWEVIKKNPKNDISKDLFDLVATKREIPIDKRAPDRDGNMMFIVDIYKSVNQDHSDLYYNDMFQNLNPRQNKIARMLLEDITHKTIKRRLRLTDTVFSRELKTIQTKVKERL